MKNGVKNIQAAAYNAASTVFIENLRRCLYLSKKAKSYSWSDATSWWCGIWGIIIIIIMDAMREFESRSMGPKQTSFKRRKEIRDDAKNDHPNRSIQTNFNSIKWWYLNFSFEINWKMKMWPHYFLNRNYMNSFKPTYNNFYSLIKRIEYFSSNWRSFERGAKFLSD